MIHSLAILGGAGLLLALTGRLLLLREDRALSPGWRLALLAIPLADLIYLAGVWPRGKTGGMVALLGAVLLAPVVGELAIAQTAATGGGLRTHVASLLVRRPAPGSPSEGERLREHKEAKVAALSAYLDRWHVALQARRAALGQPEAEELRKFDAEAAAYHALNTVAKEELRGFQQLAAAKP